MKRATKLKKIQRFHIDWTQSYTSLLLGVVVVIVAILFVASLLKSHTPRQETTSVSTENVIPTPTPDENIYIVKDGDSLWNVAVLKYNNGYLWTEIAKANNLKDPNEIEVGQKLTIPQLNPTPAMNQADNPTAINADTYTVKHGDNLWEIAVRAYADGYRWTEIAKANNLANPNLIYSGNFFTIPR